MNRVPKRKSMKGGSTELDLIPVPRLREGDAIREGLANFVDNARMIVAITDDRGRLSGIVSAGDLRKSLLNGHSLDSPLHSVMNREPVCITQEQLSQLKNVGRVVSHLKERYGDAAMPYALVPVVTKEKQVLGALSIDMLTAADATPSRGSFSRTVLVVGGAGYIGSVLTRILINAGWNVRVLDKLLYTRDSLTDLDPEKFAFIKGDAHNIDTLVKAVEDVEAVVYLAELVGDPACALAPQTTLKTNYLAVTSIAHLCSHLSINRLVYMSSCSVYGSSKTPDELLTEESALEPVSLYARTKILTEQAIFLVRNLPNPLFAPTILRLATVFGHSYRPRFDLVVNTFAKNAWQNGAIEVMGGDQWRPNVHVSDVGRAILAVLDAPIERVRGQIFNVGNGAENHTISELADLAREVFPSLKVVKRDDAVDNRNYRVDFSKIERVLGFKAKVSVKEGMLEVKKALAKNGFSPDESRFSNMKRLKELNLA